MSFSHSKSGHSHSGSVSDDPTLVIRQTYERKIKKLQITIHGYEEDIEHHDKIITEWKSKTIALEDELHTWKTKCGRMEVRIHEFEDAEKLDHDNDDKREHLISK